MKTNIVCTIYLQFVEHVRYKWSNVIKTCCKEFCNEDRNISTVYSQSVIYHGVILCETWDHAQSSHFVEVCLRFLDLPLQTTQSGLPSARAGEWNFPSSLPPLPWASCLSRLHWRDEFLGQRSSSPLITARRNSRASDFVCGCAILYTTKAFTKHTSIMWKKLFSITCLSDVGDCNTGSWSASSTPPMFWL